MKVNLKVIIEEIEKELEDFKKKYQRDRTARDFQNGQEHEAKKVLERLKGCQKEIRDWLKKLDSPKQELTALILKEILGEEE